VTTTAVPHTNRELIVANRNADPTGYAPRALVLDPGALELSESSISSAFGTVVAHSRRTDRSPRATIFLHGAAGSWTTWTPMLTVATDLGVTIPNPVLVDMPGWGAAALTASGEVAVLEAACSLVRDAAESLGFTEWDLVGHSMGGLIAMHMAAIWPESVVSVGTVSATAWSVIDAIDRPARRFGSLPGFVMLWRAMQGLSRLPDQGQGVVRFIHRLRLLRGATSPLFRHPGRVPANVIAALAREVRPRSFSIAARGVRGYHASGTWSTIECPVRAVLGDRDVFSRSDDLVRLAEILPDSSRAVIPDSGHFALIEQPAAVLRELGFIAA
jgi:pimeloyl-ACP methyl ester carboxylesterase